MMMIIITMMIMIIMIRQIDLAPKLRMGSRGGPSC